MFTKKQKKIMKKLPTKSKHYLIGGSIGIIICVFLFCFYLFAYFPLMEQLNDRSYDVNFSILPAFITGHAFPLLAHFVVEGSPAISYFCPNVEKICTRWSAGTFPEAEPWIMDGTTGYCQDLSMVPTASCSDRVEQAGFVILSIMLIIAYFFLGIFIAWLIPKIKKLIKSYGN